MINNNTISRIYILTNPVLINDTAGFYTCLQFDKAGFQKHLNIRDIIKRYLKKRHRRLSSVFMNILYL
jgi:hypothetical protein